MSAGARRRVARLILAFAVILGAAASAPADDARALLDRARELNKTERHWTDRRQKLSLEIVDRRGGVRRRELQLLQKKYDDDRSKTILFFSSPAEIKNTGFLQWVDPHSKNQQWLYLPELKRVRQISGTSKRESFMGTDFSYEDLAIAGELLDWSASDADAVVERQEPCEPDTCSVLLFRPKAKEIAYASVRAWLDDKYRLRRIEFLNGEGEALKRLEIADIRDVGRIPTSFRFEMFNLRGGSRTVVAFQQVDYDVGVSDSQFTERRLEKGL